MTAPVPSSSRWKIHRTIMSTVAWSEELGSAERTTDRRFASLAENPNLGKPRAQIRKGYFGYAQGSHVIFYLVREDGIDIISIPHQRMDVTSRFSGS